MAELPQDYVPELMTGVMYGQAARWVEPGSVYRNQLLWPGGSAEADAYDLSVVRCSIEELRRNAILARIGTMAVDTFTMYFRGLGLEGYNLLAIDTIHPDPAKQTLWVERYDVLEPGTDGVELFGHFEDAGLRIGYDRSGVVEFQAVGRPVPVAYPRHLSER